MSETQINSADREAINTKSSDTSPVNNQTGATHLKAVETLGIYVIDTSNITRQDTIQKVVDLGLDVFITSIRTFNSKNTNIYQLNEIEINIGDKAVIILDGNKENISSLAKFFKRVLCDIAKEQPERAEDIICFLDELSLNDNDTMNFIEKVVENAQLEEDIAMEISKLFNASPRLYTDTKGLEIEGSFSKISDFLRDNEFNINQANHLEILISTINFISTPNFKTLEAKTKEELKEAVLKKYTDLESFITDNKLEDNSLEITQEIDMSISSLIIVHMNLPKEIQLINSRIVNMLKTVTNLHISNAIKNNHKDADAQKLKGDTGAVLSFTPLKN